MACVRLSEVSKKTNTAAGMGAAVIFVITVASAVCSIIYNQILVRFGMEYLQTIVFILVIACLVQFVELVLKKFSRSLYNALGGISAINYNKLCGTRCCF